MNRITLSFDNGPHPAVTNAVLDILAAHGVLTTFFVIGEKLNASPAARASVERAHAAGHWIGNHSHSHRTPLGRLDADTARREITQCQDALSGFSHPDKLFRPFGAGGNMGLHLLNDGARRTLEDGRYTCVTWNAIPRDWDDPKGWPTRAKDQCRQQPWTLMVLHDLEGACLEGLDGFLTWLKAEGFDNRQDFPDECVPIRRGKTDVSVFDANTLSA